MYFKHACLLIFDLFAEYGTDLAFFGHQVDEPVKQGSDDRHAVA